MKTKQCTKCREIKPLSEFNKDRNTKDGFQFWCRTCQKDYYNKHSDEIKKRSRKWHKRNRNKVKERKREYYKENRDHIRKRIRKNSIERYGITLREYDLMLKIQGGSCAICGRTPKQNGKRLAVDHDHETGKVRELLCDRCNKILGMIDDSPDLCAQAEIYLQKHGK